jgi:hypothetical protein
MDCHERVQTAATIWKLRHDNGELRASLREANDRASAAERAAQWQRSASEVRSRLPWIGRHRPPDGDDAV